MWRGRPRPRKQPFGWRSHFGNRFVGHVHSSLTRNSAPTHSGIGDGGRGPTRSMSTKAPPLTKYRYRRRLPHLQKADAAVFVTFCTAGRLALPEQTRDLVLEHCLRESGIQSFAGEGARATRVHLYAAVVMPDHVHMLFLPLRDEEGWPYPLVDILQCLKSVTAHRINRLLHTSGPVWEEESFDHVLRSDESLKEKCEYIRQNPVTAGLVQKPEDYRWLWVSPEFGF